MAIYRYMCMKDPKVARCWVDSATVVVGKVGPAIGDTTKLGVAATDAGTNCADGKIAGDAAPDEAVV